MVGGVATRPEQVVEPPETGAPRPRTEVRPEIQALRALAVSTVVIYHFWASGLSGGFIGVDVFFAISGFLITSHLLREVDRSGAVSLAGFWARRARRILPAALLILMLVALVTIIFVPETYWQQYLAEDQASTAYIENWYLAHAAVDYLAALNAASPVQHFWSLSAEEQFYIFWPVLILGAALVTRGRTLRIKRRTIFIVLAVIVAASFAFSVYDTNTDPAQAYFITPTRAWEFGLGGLLALAATNRMRPAASAALSWIGLALIMFAAITYTGTTPFPGSAAAIPVLGCLAVIWAGAPQLRWAPTGLFGLRPIQFLGDISYSVYLWHFPLLILTPFILDQNMNLTTKIILIPITILAAWLTKKAVEDPMRRSRFLITRRPRWTFAFVIAATALVFAVTAAGKSHLAHQLAKEQTEAKSFFYNPPHCFGAASRDPQHPCTNPSLKYQVQPTPIVAEAAKNAPCGKTHHDDLVTYCGFGVLPDHAVRTFALVGDSHAQMWRSPMTVVAKDLEWRGLTVARTSCPFSTTTKKLVEPLQSECVKWNKEVIAWFFKHPEINTVFVAAHNGGPVVVPQGETTYSAEIKGYQEAWSKLPPTVHHIVVIRDTPGVRTDTQACVQQAISAHRQAGIACAVPKLAYLPPDPEAGAAKRLHSPRVQTLDINKYICDAKLCYPVVGGSLVFKDVSHVTKVFGRTLGPYFERRIRDLLRGWQPNTR